MKKGSLSLVTGPMFSGKTEWLIKNLKGFKNDSIAIRYAPDTRYSENSLKTHDGIEIKARSAKNLSDIKKIIKYGNFLALGIDEVQFFRIGILNIIEELKEMGIKVFASGLDLDFKKNSWETTEKLSKIADEVVKLQAYCTICKKKNAIYSKRLSKSPKRVVIGGSAIYEARCENHFEVSYS